MRILGDPFARALGRGTLGLGAPDNPVVWLLLDQFITDDAAPVTSPRTCEPGPGSVQFTDTENLLNIAGGEVSMSAVNTVTNTPLVEAAAMFARATGRLFQARAKRSSTVGANNLTPWIGWRTNAGESILPGESSTNSQIFPGSVPIREFVTVNVYNLYSIVLRSAGCWIFLDNKLVWVNLNDTTANMNPGIRQNSTGRRGMVVDYIGIRDLLPAAVWGNDFGIAAMTDTTIVSNDTFTGTADAINDFNFTLPGTPAANDEVTMEYRRLDANNKWKAYMKRNAGNTAWDFLLDSVAAGTPTNRITVTGVSADLIRVIAEGTKHDCYTRSGSTWTKRGSQVDVSHQDGETGMAIVAVAGTTLSRITSWSRSSSLYSELSRM